MNELQIYHNILRTDLCAYEKHVNLGWKVTKFHRFLCDTVQDFIEEETGHAFDILIISTPPQHGKSVTITETLPSWYLGNNPDNRVIEVSYNSDFAKTFGRSNLRKIRDYGDIFGIQLGDSQNVLDFNIEGHNGGMVSTGILSGITGRKANLVIIDDPVKNQEEADSETQRNKIINEWLSSIRTRIWVGGKVICIMTRWHEDDLAGYLIANEQNVKVINIPLEAEENDILGRKIGDALCPEIGKDNAWLEDFKKGYLTKNGTRSWNALFQGRPSSLDGNLFKREWWQYYDELPQIAEWVMSVDCTFKDKDDSDFVAIQVWGKTNANMYLIDRVKSHLNIVDTMKEIYRLRSMYPMCKVTLIEDKANGSAVIQLLKNTLSGLIPVEPKGGKYARANAVIGAIESGNVYLPKNKPWVYEFVEEHAVFPNGKHDDEVDCCTQALNRMIYSSGALKPLRMPDLIEQAFPMTKKKGFRGRGEKINVI